VVLLSWLRAHDPGYAALRRAARGAIVQPALFAYTVKVMHEPVVGTFAAFGAFAMLLLVDFAGPMRDRLRNQAALALACCVLISLATLVSRTTWPATLTMAAVGFGVLFAGVASSTLAAATPAMLLSFILPVTLAGPVSSIPDRLLGWGMAAACSLLAIALLWPAPARDPVRTRAIAACRALAARLRAVQDERATAASDDAVRALREAFYATPFRPTGLSTAARAVVRLVDELRWLDDVVQTHPSRGGLSREARAVREAAARVLDDAAALLEHPAGSPAALRAATEDLRAALGDLERSTTTTLPAPGAPASEEQAHAIVSALDPSFRAQELSFVVAQIASNADVAAAAERRSWVQRLLGRPPAGFPGTLSAAQERAGAHLERSSTWLQNSVRGGIGLGLAVLVAELSSVQHAFWVVLGTLSVLRSNALSTGQNVLRAIGGTTAGFVVGGTLVWLIGTDETLLWILLPIAILCAGFAPAAISFAAGQAAFTLTVLIIFNILQPAGWDLGLVRIEDVALGCAVSLVVGLLLWPRGAGAALGRALSAAYRDSAAYLAGAVAFGVGRCDAGAPAAPEPTEESVRAAASSRRLDDTFRSYLAERGAKPVPMADISSLVTGVVALRLAGDAVLDLWRSDGADGGDRGAARRELVAGAQRMTGWYGDLGAGLAGGGAVPEPLPADAVADGRLVDAVSRDLRDPDGRATGTAVRVIWTGDHLDAARRLQETLAGPARAAVQTHALSSSPASPSRRPS
jgi:uncharacterized membrane protein YccC